jgi:hypothetical protein
LPKLWNAFVAILQPVCSGTAAFGAIVNMAAVDGVHVMAIEALYPSRRQSRWANPLFRRPRLRRARKIALGTLIVAFAFVSGVHVIQQLPVAANPIQRPATIDAMHGKTLLKQQSSVRVVPLAG